VPGGSVEYDTEGPTIIRCGEATPGLLDAGDPHERDGTVLRVRRTFEETADRILH
jgi:hypothetical protein